MRNIAIAIGLSALSSTTALAQVNTIFGPGGVVTSSTGPVAVNQNSNLNTIGVAQAGGAPAATINQAGFYNVSSIAQNGTTNTANVTQTGTFNRSCISQFGATNNAAVTQTGANNSSTVFQSAGLPPGSLSTLVQNCLTAPGTTPTQVDIGQISEVRFVNTLFGQLDNDRWQDCPAAAEPSRPMYTKALAPPARDCSKFSIFWQGTYGNGDQGDQLGQIGFRQNQYAVTGGAEYRFNQHLLGGIAINFTRANADYNGGAGSSTLDSTQVGVFGSFFYPNFFVDAMASWGGNNYNILRPGFGSPLTASPNGHGFAAAGRAGYLFDFGTFRLGPIAQISYLQTTVDAYTESGDQLLTQLVRQQTGHDTIGAVGAQIRSPFSFGAFRVDPYLNLTVEHDFRNGLQIVQTAFTQNPASPIFTPVQFSNQTYGKVAGGMNFYVSPTVSALVTAESTVGRTGGQLFAANVGLKTSF